MRCAARLVLSAPFVLLLACAGHQAAGVVHWTYAGDHGPAHWGGLDPSFAPCAEGRSQSPIDIVSAEVVQAELPALTFDYGATPLVVINNGHTIQAEVAPGHDLAIGEDHYELVQLHFHGPSEHTIDGQHAAMELHLVHEGPNGALAVVGVMIQPGADSPALASLWQHMPAQAGGRAEPPGVALALPDLLPSRRDAWRYVGSLTTPPCSEGVRWHVLTDAIAASPEQLAAFADLVGPNNRPIQPLHGRVVEMAAD